ncbi:MAG TPA: hypothetical protein VLJ58_16830 [Ramlibacter sp.]|nr:hypothetical protein [Ramlibacter sp.]
MATDARNAAATPTDWTALRLAFVNGAMTLVELARAHGINDSTMRARANREDWQAQRNEAQRAATAQAQAAITESRADQLREFNDADLRVARALRAMVARRLNNAAANPDEPLRAADLRALAAAAHEAQRIGRLALGISTENLGHGGPNGQGPVPLADIPAGEYAAALRQALNDF